MYQKTLRQLFMIMILIAVWWIVSLKNTILVPSILDVLHTMFTQMQDPLFYHAVLMTLFRACTGFLISYLFALILAFLAYKWHWLEDMLSPVVILLKSVPNISFILLILIWFSREVSVMIIVFFILFPSFYSNFITGLQAIDPTLKEVMILYPQSFFQEVRRILFPLLAPYRKASFSSGIGLAFKVGVMAEILGQVPNGIGKKLQWSYLNLDMAGVFAWTFWLVLLLLALEKGLVFLLERTHKN